MFGSRLILIKKSKKSVWIVLAVILLVAFVENGCAQAIRARLRIRRGMTVSEALQVSGDWTWGFAYSERPAPEPLVHLPFSQFSIFLGGDHRQRFASLDEVAQALDQQMTGHRGACRWPIWERCVTVSQYPSTHKARYKASRASGSRNS